MPKNGNSWDFHNLAEIQLMDKESNYTKKFSGPWTLRPFEIGTYCPDENSPVLDDGNCGPAAERPHENV